MMKFKRILIPVLAALTALSLSVPAYAADEKISTVKLKVEIGDEPEAGD